MEPPSNPETQATKTLVRTTALLSPKKITWNVLASTGGKSGRTSIIIAMTTMTTGRERLATTPIIDESLQSELTLYEFLDHCGKEVARSQGKPAVVSFAPNKSSVSETGEALKALGHVGTDHMSNPIGSTVARGPTRRT